MPQRILKPAWENFKSPITLKSLLLFLVAGFIAYTVITDYQQRQASFDRYKAIAQYTEESRSALEAAKQQNEALDVSLKATSESLKEITDLLVINRAAQFTEHEMIMNQRVARRRTRRSKLTECYELRPIEKTFGATTVVIQMYVKVQCK